ncbi:MAG: hypothetical protein WC551_08020 [Patescibacteria group bacterium]
MTQPQLLPQPLCPNDAVDTPDWCAADMVQYFTPTGLVLEPALGDGAIYRHLPPDSQYCEIRQGRDFLAFREPVDWIISNPPYSLIKEFTSHAFEISDNVVWLMPVHSYFRAWHLVLAAHRYGGLAVIRFYGPGRNLGFANPIGALHWQRSYDGPVSISFCPRSTR